MSARISGGRIVLGLVGPAMIAIGLAMLLAPPAEPEGRHALLEASAARSRAKNQPVLLMEHDGIRIWKVRDQAGGADRWIYFSPEAQVRTAP